MACWLWCILKVIFVCGGLSFAVCEFFVSSASCESLHYSTFLWYTVVV